jgi:hypothetical protein
MKVLLTASCVYANDCSWIYYDMTKRTDGILTVREFCKRMYLRDSNFVH